MKKFNTDKIKTALLKDCVNKNIESYGLVKAYYEHRRGILLGLVICDRITKEQRKELEVWWKELCTVERNCWLYGEYTEFRTFKDLESVAKMLLGEKDE